MIFVVLLVVIIFSILILLSMLYLIEIFLRLIGILDIQGKIIERIEDKIKSL